MASISGVDGRDAERGWVRQAVGTITLMYVMVGMSTLPRKIGALLCRI